MAGGQRSRQTDTSLKLAGSQTRLAQRDGWRVVKVRGQSR